MKRGIILAISAYLFWGIHPIYWKQLNHISSTQIVSFRIFFSFIFFVMILLFRGQWPSLKEKLRGYHRRWLLFLPAFLIGTNWAAFIWAVNSDYIIEISLGYFVCPLMQVFLGVFILNERLRRWQWLAVILAGTGVLAMTVIYGQFPWVALYLGATWALYGLLRKKSPLGPVEGLALETAVLSIPVIIYLFYLGNAGQIVFLSEWWVLLLLIGSGIIGGLPLIVFITASKLIKFSQIGILQYIYPTVVFFIGWLVYNEPLDEAKMIGFIFIWLALVVYTVDGSVIHGRDMIRRKMNSKAL